MAKKKYLEILRRGVENWNLWRKNNADKVLDFSGSDLRNVNLSGANLRNINLCGADLSSTDLSAVYLRHSTLIEANLSGADIRGTELTGANLSKANLSRANLSGSYLTRANLSYCSLRNANLRDASLVNADLRNADLNSADLKNADLNSADLKNADLGGTDLYNADLEGTNLQRCSCNYTVFTNTDLSKTVGLDKVNHGGPSFLDIETIFRSKGKIPEIFLRGCGVPGTLITFLPSMLEEAIQFYSCFISYSHDDKAFAQLLHDRLQGQGIRCWLDEHQLKPGDELHKTIYEGIRVYDKVILCCSETALQSWWVEKEFKNAISKEEDYTETVLIPITLDDYLFKQSADNWTVGEIKRRFVQDFSNWKDHDAFEAAFKKVVDALRTDGGKPPPPTSKLTRRKP